MKAQQSETLDSSREVKRRIKLPGLVRPEDAHGVEVAISTLPGLRKAVVDTERHLVDIRYDATLTDYISLLAALKNAGHSPVDSWWSRLKRSWIEFTENNIRDNAKAPPPSCCNKPPK